MSRLYIEIFDIYIYIYIYSNAEAAVKGGYWYYDSGLDPSDIDSSYFTHLFCAFAQLDSTTNHLTLPSTAFSTFTQTVLQNNPSLKTLLSIGGGGNGSAPFSTMANNSTSRKAFIDSSIQVARSNKFHGLDLDWEYPSSDTDKTNLGLLLNEWRAAIAQEASSSGNTPLLLSAAVAGSNQITNLQYYPAEEIASNMDWVNVMVYDLFVPDGAGSTQPPAPLYNPTGLFSGDQGINGSWINQLGVPPNKLAIGLPFYGYAWTLVDANAHGLFAGANGAGSIPSGGSIPVYRDIRSFINNGAQTVYNSTYVTNYCYSGTTWVGYDDTQSVSAKVSYAKERGLIGYFAWQIGGDDNNWTLSKTASDAWGS
ncbi:class V chitinase [Arachis duranensis]|uniref:Class V chitinase n=1 Tax=Arachis duranensis TaxID=130453 RepID=A0A6P5MVT7_ARADU|nr:class V chitinase [Arachis duranensis]